MKIRFDIDQAECFRNGIDAPKSIVSIEVDPATIPADERNMIADRLDGIDVCKLEFDANGVFTMHRNTFGQIGRFDQFEYPDPVRIMAKTPDYTGLTSAIRENQKDVEERRKRHQAMMAIAREAADDLLNSK